MINLRKIFIFPLVILSCLIALCPALAANQISNISASQKNDKTQLKFELSSQTRYRIFTTSKPNRLVVDFDDQSKLKFDLDDFSNPLFSSVKKSLNNQDQLRITFTLKNSVRVQKSSVSKIKNKYYLTINLSPKNSIVPTKEETSLTENNLSSVSTQTAAGVLPANPPVVTEETLGSLGKFIDEKIVDKETGTVTYVVKKTKRLPVIIIDAGHGGKDPGTIGKFARSKEKFVTLGYARELKRQLDLTGKYKVSLTRDKDFFIPLNGRVAKARAIEADLFISLHADSSPDRDTYGLSVYTLSDSSSDKQAALLAQKENKSDIIGGANFSDASGDILKTLINLSQRSTMNESAKFAEIAIKSVRENGVNTIQKSHRFAGFRVLTAPDIPSVLIELGYLSNKDEEKKLNSLGHKKEVAEALVDAVGNYF